MKNNKEIPISDFVYFTVFTPSYNRANTLPRVFESLQRQSFNDFEWLIIDDGSSDKTNQLVEEFKKSAKFSITYKWVTNRGKHKVKNIAVNLANGKFFFTLDSDDWIEPETLDRFKYHWENIPSEKKHLFSGVAGLTKFAGDSLFGVEGKLNGTKNPQDIIDTDMISIRTKYKVRGEKCGTHLTSVMRQFLSPEFDNEKFSPEAIVWRRIAKQGYLVRYTNEIYRNQEIQPGGLSDPKQISIRATNNPKGLALRFNEEVDIMPSFLLKLKSSINYVRCSLHANYSFLTIIKGALEKRYLVLSLLVGYVLSKYDISKFN
ncbi:glycosyltransferase family A protein [Flavobacteriaceae bacterium]|nr:glycosyltransferase family A protein [Flavobacteriaceae bacterium]